MAKPAEPQDGKQRTASTGLGLLIIVGIVVLAVLTLRSAISLVLFTVTTSRVGWTGDFSSELLPIIDGLVIVGVGSFGVYKLAGLLRK